MLIFIRLITVCLLKAFKEKAELEAAPENVQKHLIVAVSSDKGLCGAIHTSIVKAVKASINNQKDGLETKIICVGEKAKAILQRTYATNMLFSVSEIGKRNASFLDASEIASEILKSGYEFDSGELLYNRFK